MRKVAYWPTKDRLVYLDEAATPEFWDSHRQGEGEPAHVSQRDYAVTVTKKYLGIGSRILEGGCGRANKVKAISDAGFNAIGIDFAEETVRQAREYYPKLDIRKGDVRSLEFPDSYFDGYWSFGVIEHFWVGYDAILAEAARVLRPRGFLFLTAPWFSPYRRHKASRGAYPSIDPQEEPKSFFQFALGRDEVTERLENHGFQLQRWRGLASEVSMKDDGTALRGLVDWLLGSRGSIPKRVLRRVVTRGLNPYCGHTFLAVARKTH